MGVTKQEEKEKRVLGDWLLPLPLTPREEPWTTEEAWKGSLKGRFPLVLRVSLVASARSAAPGCSAQFGPYPKASRDEPQKTGSLNCGLIYSPTV